MKNEASLTLVSGTKVVLVVSFFWSSRTDHLTPLDATVSQLTKVSRREREQIIWWSALRDTSSGGSW